LESSRDRWATCALTELGFIRLSSNPAAVLAAKTPAEAAALLAAMVKDPLHVYLKSLSPPSDEESIQVFERIFGSKQVTDAYLLRLARQHRAKLTTFDSKLRALVSSEREIEILTD
jgi:predicted nucleic acid-binding protein